jgi:hypothetical protein
VHAGRQTKGEKMQGTMMSYPLTLVHLLDWQWRSESCAGRWNLSPEATTSSLVLPEPESLPFRATAPVTPEVRER